MTQWGMGASFEKESEAISLFLSIFVICFHLDKSALVRANTDKSCVSYDF